MPIKLKDKVVLNRRGTQVDIGTHGTVVKILFEGVSLDEVRHTDDAVIVEWDVVTAGSRIRSHRPSSLDPVLKFDVPADNDKPSAVSRKLTLLGFEDAPIGLNAAVAFSDTIKGIAEASHTLTVLRKSLKNIAIYKGTDMNLYLSMQGKDVVLAKEVDGVCVESISLPLSVYTKLVETYRQGL